MDIIVDAPAKKEDEEEVGYRAPKTKDPAREIFALLGNMQMPKLPAHIQSYANKIADIKRIALQYTYSKKDLKFLDEQGFAIEGITQLDEAGKQQRIALYMEMEKEFHAVQRDILCREQELIDSAYEKKITSLARKTKLSKQKVREILSSYR